MTLRYLLDSNALSEPVKPSPNPVLSELVLSRLRQIATAATVWHELLRGYYLMVESRRKRDLERYLFETLAPNLSVLPYNQQAAMWHASERVRLERIGRTPPFVDGQIAAVAFVNGLLLVTANVSDFSSFQGLRVENWRAP